MGKEIIYPGQVVSAIRERKSRKMKITSDDSGTGLLKISLDGNLLYSIPYPTGADVDVDYPQEAEYDFYNQADNGVSAITVTEY